MPDQPQDTSPMKRRLFLKTFLRSILMVPAVMSATFGILNGSALLFSITAAIVAVFAAELPILKRLRLGIVFVGWCLGSALVQVWRWSIIQLDLVPSIIGATEALWLQMAVGTALLIGILVLALRLFARSNTLGFAFETAVISLAVGSAFFPHQYRF